MILRHTLAADLETPLSVFLKLAGNDPYACLLESVEGGTTLGRYSIIAAKPDLLWRCIGNEASLSPGNNGVFKDFKNDPLPPLSSLRALIKQHQLPPQDGLPPAAGGLFGYMGFDMVRHAEPKLGALRPHPFGLPHSIFMRPTIMGIFDNVQQTLTLTTPVWPETDTATAQQRLDSAIALLQQPLQHEAALTINKNQVASTVVPQSNTTRAAYHAIVARAKDYIAAGDIFQVVPSQRFTVPYAPPPLQFYRNLRRLNPSPFLVYMALGDHHIAASSPEILVRVRDGEVTIRPIAGTRKRGKDPAEDLALAEDLLADDKERAEHFMLLDLGRNDVGRSAKLGSVKVTQQMIIEHYSHVMHMVSNVTGQLRADKDALDALLAGFPAGTVSGAPKIRAIEIIDELEPEARGHYGGCMGYFSAFGDLDSCIALRTAVIKDGVAYVQAGGGVVADSDFEAEYQESCNKAAALIKAALT